MSKLELGELQITALTDIERFDVPLTTIFPEAKSDEIKNINSLLERNYTKRLQVTLYSQKSLKIHRKTQ